MAGLGDRVHRVTRRAASEQADLSLFVPFVWSWAFLLDTELEVVVIIQSLRTFSLDAFFDSHIESETSLALIQFLALTGLLVQFEAILGFAGLGDTFIFLSVEDIWADTECFDTLVTDSLEV